VQVVVLLVHLADDAARRLEGLAGHRRDDLVVSVLFAFSTACAHICTPM